MTTDSRSQQLSSDEASAILRLTASAEWKLLEAYLQRRLNACHDDLGTLSTDTARGQVAQAQGKRIEINAILNLRERAEKVLEAVRSR